MKIRSALLLSLAIGSLGASGPVAARTRQHPGHGTVQPSPDAAGPVPYLLAARTAAGAGRYGQASDSLGRAETRLLNDAAASPDSAPPFLRRALSDVAAARASSARGQRTPTVQAINDALLALEPQPFASAADRMPAPPVDLPPMPPPPAVLYRSEPGRWQLHGAQSVWIEPQAVPQPVSVRPVVPSREVWNGDRWVLVPEHFAGTEIAR